MLGSGLCTSMGVGPYEVVGRGIGEWVVLLELAVFLEWVALSQGTRSHESSTETRDETMS